MTLAPETPAVPPVRPVLKIPTGIVGFDQLTSGGLPEGRTTLVVGTSGSCKTLFSMECLWRSLKQYQRNAVLVTLEEPLTELRRNVLGLNWDFGELIEGGGLRVVDASPLALVDTGGDDFDLSALMEKIVEAIEAIDAQFVVIDAIGTLFSQLPGDFIIRRELLRLCDRMRVAGVTTLMTAERMYEYGPISRYGVEEYLSDGVVVLRNVLEEERCRRTMQVLKLRGNAHLKGEFPFTLTDEGLCVLTISADQLDHPSTTDRIASGNARLDEVAGGGFFRDSIILVSGATGTGKTLLTTTFASEGCRQGERTLVLAFEESRPQLLRNATGWGMGFEEAEKEGVLRVVCTYPESMGLEDHLVQIQREVDEFKPVRLVIDSLSALERVGSMKVFREFVIGLSALAKERSICTLLTSTTPGLAGGESITEAHISTLTDAIILLRYVEIGSRLRRGIAVIKMRGSAHDKDVIEYRVDQEGMHLMQPFKNVHGIILGTPQSSGDEEAALVQAFE
jgi:circadian clock protein KaiC